MITFTFEEIRAFKPRTVLRDGDSVDWDWIKDRDGFWYSADDVRLSYQIWCLTKNTSSTTTRKE